MTHGSDIRLEALLPETEPPPPRDPIPVPHTRPDTWEPVIPWPDRPEWMRRGNCAGTDPAIFFPKPGDPAATKKAKEVCSDCPVRGECLEFVLWSPDGRWGVWGGTTPLERRRLRRQRAREAA